MTNEQLVQEYQNGNNQALDELIKKNTGLVTYFAKRYHALCPMASMEITDLIQEGWIGLISAAQKYNPDLPIQDEDYEVATTNEPKKVILFSSYAGRAIQHKIHRAVNKNIPRIKQSDTYSEPIMVNSINALLPGADETTLEVMTVYSPDSDPFISYKDVETKMDDQILRKDLMYLLDSVFGSEFKYINNGQDLNGVEDVNSLFYKLLDGINGKEVLLLHYGLFGRAMTYKEIGQLVGVSSSRIEQIQFQGISRIRHSMQGKKFMDKYEIRILEGLEQIKESINKYSPADKVLFQIEYIDDILKKYLTVNV